MTRVRTFNKKNSQFSSPNKKYVFIMNRMAYFRDYLRHYGYLQFNTVLSELGFELAKDGYKIGWIDLEKFVVDLKQLFNDEGDIRITFKGLSVIEVSWYLKYKQHLELH